MRFSCLAVLALIFSASIYGSDYVTQVIAWSGDPAPVTNPANATYNPVFISLNDRGDLLFSSQIEFEGNPPKNGIFVDEGGVIRPIVLRGDWLPATPAPVDQVYGAHIDQEGRILTLTASEGTNYAIDLTIWDANGPQDVTRFGEPLFAGGYPVKAISFFAAFNNGRVAYVASFETENFDDVGLYVDDRGDIYELARRYTGTADGTSDATPSSFENVRMNSAGEVFFSMTYQPADEQQLIELNGYISDEGYYLYDGTNNNLIARRFQTMPGGKVITGIGDASINLSGVVAFIGYHIDSTSAVYVYEPFFGLQLILKSGDTVDGLTIATGPQGAMTGIQIADTNDILLVATVAGTTTFPNSDGIIRHSPVRGLELLAYETQVAPPPVIGQTFTYQHFARASINRDGFIAIDAVMEQKPVFDAITNHVLYIEDPITREMKVAATPGQTISHSLGADVMVRLNSFGGIQEQPGPPVASGSGEDGFPSVFNASKIHTATICGRVRDGFGVCKILPALVVNDAGDQEDANLLDDLPDINPALEGNQLTLRAAIQNANKRLGRDTIVFDIPPEQGVEGFFIIDVPNPLPEITEAVTIDGKTQPGYAGVPRVSVDGGVEFQFKREQPAMASKGLILNADKCNISGLAFNQFPGPAIEAHNTNGHTVSENYLGLDNIHDAPGYGNRIGVLLDRSAAVKIRNNFIADNGVGVRIEGIGQLAAANFIEDNKIGTNGAGTGNVGNFFAGIHVDGADGNFIARNVIGWNAPANIIQSEGILTPVGGIVFTGQAAVVFPFGNSVRENYIGVAANGTTPMPNFDGIVVDTYNRIDIGQLGGGNLISGNFDAGVKIMNVAVPPGLPGADVLPLAGFPFGLGFGELPPLAGAAPFFFTLKIEDNYIGTTTTGTAALPNDRGIVLLDSSGVFINFNVISGNKLDGIEMTGTVFGNRFNVVNNNIIGGTAGALAALPNRNGILLDSADQNIIQLNEIIANNEAGIYFFKSQKNFTTQNQIGRTGLGNKNAGIYGYFASLSILGAGPSGDVVQENGNYGIYLESCTDVAIGNELIDKNKFGGVAYYLSSSCVMDTTYITNNKGPGITVVGGGNNHFLPTSIEKNDGIAIDLLDNGVTENDLNDLDDGPNGVQNFPVLDSLVSLGGGDYFIAGRLTGLPNTLYVINFYDSPDADPSKHGEGTTLFWFRVVVTDETGFVRFTADPRGVGTLSNVSAIATPANLRAARTGTSEFSLSIKPIAVGIDLELTQTTPSAPVKVNTPVEVNLTVTNKGITKATKVAIDGVLNPGLRISSFTSNVGAVGVRTAPAFAYEVGDLDPSTSANVKLTLIPLIPGPLTQVLNTRSEIFDAKIGDNRVETMIFAYTTDPVAGNQPPSVPSGISAAPNPAFQYGPVAFEALASDPESQTLSFLWNFGDETDSVVTTTGQTTHRFSEAGQFTVKLTCFDASGAATEATVIVFVTELGSAPGDNDGDSTMNTEDTDDDNDGIPDSQDADLDGDGVTNDVELNKGSNPNDKTSFPASEDGDNDGIPNTIDPDVDNDTLPNGTDPDIDGDGATNQDEQLAGTDPYNNTSKPGTLTITKFASALRFDVAGKDTLQVTGQIPDISSGAVLTGKSFVLTVGNSTQQFVLDAKGKAKTALASVAVVKPKASKKTPNVIGPATFTFKAKGTLASAILAGVSLNPAPTSVTLKFVVRFGERNGLTSRDATIAVKKGKTGQPASAKLGLPK